MTSPRTSDWRASCPTCDIDFFDQVAAVNAVRDVLLANRIDNFTLAQEVAQAVLEAVQR